MFSLQRQVFFLEGRDMPISQGLVSPPVKHVRDGDEYDSEYEVREFKSKLTDLLKKCWSRNPDVRPPAQEVLRDLQTLHSQHSKYEGGYIL